MRSTKILLGFAVSFGLISSTGVAAEDEPGLDRMIRCYGYNYVLLQSLSPMGQDIRRYIWMMQSWEEKIKESHVDDESLLAEKMKFHSEKFEKDFMQAYSQGKEEANKFLDTLEANCVPYEDKKFPGWDEYIGN